MERLIPNGNKTCLKHSIAKLHLQCSVLSRLTYFGIIISMVMVVKLYNVTGVYG